MPRNAPALFLGLFVLFHVSYGSYGDFQVGSELIQRGVVYTGFVAPSTVNVYKIDLLDTYGASNLQIEFLVDSLSSVSICPSISPYRADLESLMDLNTCPYSIEDNKMSVTLQSAAPGVYFLKIHPLLIQDITEKSAIGTKYSFSVEWQECDNDSWGLECEIQPRQLQMNSQVEVMIQAESKFQIFYLDVHTDGIQEIHMFATTEDNILGSICLAYQYGAPNLVFDDSFCSSALFHRSNPLTIGRHFFTFYKPNDSPSNVEFRISAKKYDCSVPEEVQTIQTNFHEKVRIGLHHDSTRTQMEVERIEEQVREEILLDFAVPRAASFFVDVEAEMACEFEVIVVPSHVRYVKAAATTFLSTEKKVHAKMISADSSWLLMIRLVSPFTDATFVTDMNIRISLLAEFASVGKEKTPVTSLLLPFTWKYFQFNQESRRNILVSVNNEELVVVARKKGIPSLVEFDAILAPFPEHSNSIPSSWKIGIYNPTSKTIEVEAVVEEEETDDPSNEQTGADLRVSIFIWTTFIFCGLIILASLIAFAVWCKRAWKNLKESGAYDNVMRKE